MQSSIDNASMFTTVSVPTQESKYFHMTYESDVATLKIAETYPEDEGDYMCKAVNSAGVVSSTCDVVVTGERGGACHGGAGLVTKGWGLW